MAAGKSLGTVSGGCLGFLILLVIVLAVTLFPVAWIAMLVAGAFGLHKGFWLFVGCVFALEAIVGVARGTRS